MDKLFIRLPAILIMGLIGFTLSFLVIDFITWNWNYSLFKLGSDVICETRIHNSFGECGIYDDDNIRDFSSYRFISGGVFVVFALFGNEIGKKLIAHKKAGKFSAAVKSTKRKVALYYLDFYGTSIGLWAGFTYLILSFVSFVRWNTEYPLITVSMLEELPTIVRFFILFFSAISYAFAWFAAEKITKAHKEKVKNQLERLGLS